MTFTPVIDTIKVMKRLANMGEKYYLTRTGRLFTGARNRPKKNGKLHEMAIQTNRKGYRTIVLKGADGKKHTHSLARLLYETFVAPIPQGMQIDHIDMNKTNNSLANLRIVTGNENMRYKAQYYRDNPYAKVCELCAEPFRVSVKIGKYCSPRCRSKSWAIKFKAENGYWQSTRSRTLKRQAARLHNSSI